MTLYNESLPFDKAIYAQDIQGSIAFARGNLKCGLLTESECSAIESGFETVLKEWQDGSFKIEPGIDEDIHTANERRLGEIIGKETAGKLHTGRSRNDQVATGMRLWLREQLTEIATHLTNFLRTTVSRARAEISVLMPGYTHLQRAQPIRWSHFLLSHATTFLDDLTRLHEVHSRVNRLPLGSGALVGHPFGISREDLANSLSFPSLLMNSMSAVSDRDFILETLQWATMFMTHISRWAEDLIIYSSSEFSFIRLSDAYSTGSSLMPQKKNPDALELLRGKSGRVFGLMAGLNMSIKGLPSTYNKDLQESFPPMLDAVKTVSDSLQIATGILSTLTIFPENMLKALTPEMLATDLADYLVRKGVPFRETHHISGRVVALAEREGIPMDKLTYDQLRTVDERFEKDVVETFDFEKSVEMRRSTGGTSRKAVEGQTKWLEDHLK